MGHASIPRFTPSSTDDAAAKARPVNTCHSRFARPAATWIDNQPNAPCLENRTVILPKRPTLDPRGLSTFPRFRRIPSKEATNDVLGKWCAYRTRNTVSNVLI